MYHTIAWILDLVGFKHLEVGELLSFSYQIEHIKLVWRRQDKTMRILESVVNLLNNFTQHFMDSLLCILRLRMSSLSDVDKTRWLLESMVNF